jgi:hypothetical protein
MTAKVKRDVEREKGADRVRDVEAQHEEEARQVRLERRCSPRWRLQTAATCFQLGGDDFGRMHELRIVDYSDGGLGAESDTKIHPGAVVSIGFESRHLQAKRGVVVSCEPGGRGYRLAIRFEHRLAA